MILHVRLPRAHPRGRSLTPIKAPFPWFGGKSQVANLVWDRFGDVPNYVEPFFGSGAVLFGRPTRPQIETVNDLDGFVSNFWRAVQAKPDEVAEHADWPVNENDLHARHIWLVGARGSLQSRLEGNPQYFDTRIAGWWVWGMAAWIGGGFCSGKGPWQSVDGQLVHLGNAGRGVNRKLVHLGDAGRGVNRKREDLLEYFQALQNRLRNVRVCSGDWSRVCGPSPTFKNGVTGVFLDPPYSEKANRVDVYSIEDKTVAHTVCKWAIDNGDNSELRIALCGYEGEHEMPESWECIEWKASGGYGSQGKGRGRDNCKKERIWFSRHCLKPHEGLPFEKESPPKRELRHRHCPSCIRSARERAASSLGRKGGSIRSAAKKRATVLRAKKRRAFLEAL